MDYTNLSTDKIFRYVWWPYLLLILAACDTEYENVPYPYKEITSFAVASAGTEINAAIVDNQIVLYWPYTLARPTSISPQITISENAAITPVSGASVPLQDGVAYTITAQDGTTLVYTLKLVVNQPDVTLNEDQKNTVFFETVLNIRGSGFLLDSLATQIFLISSNGTETQIPVYAVVDNFATGFASNVQATIPAQNTTAIDTGWYSVKVKSGAQTVVSSRAYVYVRYPIPTFDAITTSITVKRGETVTLTGKNFRLFGNARILIQDGSESYYDIEFVSNTLTDVTYRIPDTIPAGAYFTILPGITDTATKEFAYSYALYSYPHVHPLLIVTE